MANESTAVQKSKPPIVAMLEERKATIFDRLPRNTDQKQFFLGIMSAIQKNPDLLKCTADSVILAAYEAADIGCNLSPSLQLGWIIPYGTVAQFHSSYRFFMQRAFQTGDVKSFFAEVVYEGDFFKRVLAPQRSLKHEPGTGPRTIKERLGAYALIEFNDGTLEYEYLTNEQIDAHRKKSKQQNSMKWTEFWQEGWRITPIRVLAKRIPLKTRSIEEFVEAINRDAEVDFVIPAEVVPSAPKRTDQAPAAAQDTKPTQTQEETPGEKPAEEKPAEEKPVEQKPAEQKPTEQQAAPAKQEGMFQEGEPQSNDDPLLSTQEIQKFWDVALAKRKRGEAVEIIKTKFKVEKVNELRRSQFQAALEAVK